MADIILVMPLANRFDRASVRVPNGLLAIAALPDKAGYSVKIIDLKIDKNWRNTLRDAIGPKTLCVGISCSTGRMIASALSIAREVRSIRKDLPIVWGGPHPTLSPDQTLSHPLVDCIVINEGDKVFMELVDALGGRKMLSDVMGIGYKEGGRVRLNARAPLVKNLEELPEFPYHLIDVTRYSSLTIDGLPSIDIITSRGCPYDCAFCSTPVTSGRSWRPLPIKRVIDNIKFLKAKYDIKTFYFVDDNFMVDLKRLETFLDTLKEECLDIYWGTQGVRIDTINMMSSELLDKIEASGCKELSIGVESANPEILKSINKKIDIEDVYMANEKLAGRNFAIKFNMIIGFPAETMESIKKTVSLAVELNRKNKNTWFPFNIFTPFPGTALFDKSLLLGFRAPHDLEGWERLESTGWYKHYGNWFTEKENEFLKSINCTSYMAFSSGLSKISNPLLRMLFMAYQPLAHFRFRHMFYRFHIEKYFAQQMD